MSNIENPTAATYSSLRDAYDYFNRELFDGALPDCLVTLQRKPKCLGYFAGSRFGRADGSDVTDEIALNPSHFKERGVEDVLSTLVHEQAHLWQHHYGAPGRAGYHNREWAVKMREIGLHPSHTGHPGGKQTGSRMSHYIVSDGAFRKAFERFVSPDLLVEIWNEANERASKKKAESKTKFTCPECGANAWAKPTTSLHCGECDLPMEKKSQRLED